MCFNVSDEFTYRVLKINFPLCSKRDIYRDPPVWNIQTIRQKITQASLNHSHEGSFSISSPYSAPKLRYRPANLNIKSLLKVTKSLKRNTVHNLHI